MAALVVAGLEQVPQRRFGQGAAAHHIRGERADDAGHAAPGRVRADGGDIGVPQQDGLLQIPEHFAQPHHLAVRQLVTGGQPADRLRGAGDLHSDLHDLAVVVLAHLFGRAVLVGVLTFECRVADDGHLGAGGVGRGRGGAVGAGHPDRVGLEHRIDQHGLLVDLDEVAQAEVVAVRHIQTRLAGGRGDRRGNDIGGRVKRVLQPFVLHVGGWLIAAAKRVEQRRLEGGQEGDQVGYVLADSLEVVVGCETVEGHSASP